MRIGGLVLEERVDRHDEQSDKREGAERAAEVYGEDVVEGGDCVKEERWMGEERLYTCWLRTTYECEYGGKRGSGGQVGT